MNLEDIIEKIKRLENGGNGTNMVCFIIAFDLLYFFSDTENRERFIYEYYKNDNGMFTNNFKKICYYAESILLEDDIYRKMLKSIDMEVRRDDLVSLYNYYDAIDRIEKGNQSTKDLISDGFKIRLLKNTFDSANEEYIKLDNEVKNLKNRYDRNIIDTIIVLAVFIAISIGMVSGISFSLQAFSNITNTNLTTICTLSLVVGFVIFNLFYIIFKFVAKIAGREIDKNGVILIVDIIFVLLICFFFIMSIK